MSSRAYRSYGGYTAEPFWKRAWFYAVTISGVAALGTIFWFWGDQLLRFFFTYGRGDILFVVLILGFIGAVSAAAKFFYDDNRTFGWGSVLAAVLLIGTLIFLWFRVAYDNGRNYIDDAQTNETASNSYVERAPQQVAIASAARNLQETVGTVGITKSVADEGEFGLWNTIVTRPGIGVGYESVQAVDVPLYGTVPSSNVALCTFDYEEANHRLAGALPQNNLARLIYQNTPLSVGFDGADMYGYCAEDTPYVVVPLQQVHGFYAAEWTVYGVAQYNGSTGELRILTDVEDVADIPGPTYPMSMAERQRGAMKTDGSYDDWFFNRIGYETTAKDAEDPNGNNNSEFQLRKTDSADIAYVTPLTTRGESTTIVGTSEMDAKFTGQGRNDLIISRFPEDATRAANSTVVDDLMTTYSNLTDWATGLEVFEIVPASDGNWVASIGKSQSVLYRAEIHADGTFILTDADGNVIPDNTRGGDATPDSGTPVAIPEGADLSEFSNEELNELGKQILDELAERSVE